MLLRQLALLEAHSTEFDYFLIRDGRPPLGVTLTDPQHAFDFRATRDAVLRGVMAPHAADSIADGNRMIEAL